jgi:hypothetical protein
MNGVVNRSVVEPDPQEPQVAPVGADGDVMILVFPSGTDGEESLSTPFEEWCASMDLHPEDSRAWPLFERSVGAESHVPTAS